MYVVKYLMVSQENGKMDAKAVEMAVVLNLA